ncbi:unnamed protein product [Rhizoctonia solani]|uniref:Uncharacterized protein n=1 Tax=Rhizoctonia solani TaxID=456999 RepID=A0A8H3DDR8_9AGAM|nr:unnamed protein product [Rhizoctonia solani]CAE6516681.1 unnamed protein product [Rhizoctonia solani]
MTYPATMDWYKNSVSFRLDAIASKGKGTLPDALCAEINNAASRTFIHETRIYQGSESSPSPEWVYDGYAKAFAPLIEHMLDPDLRAKLHGIQLHVCTQLLVQLRRILAVLKARGSDSRCITYNTAVKVLVSEIDRVLESSCT